MTHRDAVSIPLLVGSFTSGTWLPAGIDLTQVGTWFMWGMGAALIAVQIRYYWKNTQK
jgi:hypothetical protein